MRYRTRSLLTGGIVTLLAVACTAGLGASKAAAASQRAATTVHKISACGYVATKSGTYELTKSVTDSGSGPCITLKGNNITLYLDAHTITGTGTDTCLLVESGGTAESVNDAVIGGTKAKPKKSAKLTNCSTGVTIIETSVTTVSNLKIVAPTDVGVVASVVGGMMLSNINVPLQASASAGGFVLAEGADNVVTKSTVDSNSSGAGFVASAEIGDSFTYDSVKDTYSNAGSAGSGFVDASSSRDTYSHDTSSGQFNGFVLADGGSGPVKATYDTATGLSTNSSSYGFEVVEAYQQADFASPFHTLISHNKTNGFQYGFFDHSDTAYAVAEKWTNNTADNYSEYGFYIDYPTDYTMTGNIADANTGGKTYAGGSTCGFCLAHPISYYPFATFANNQAYDSQYGFNSGGSFVGGKGNIAKRNLHNAVNVEIAG